jgi:tetratricopeptide (TPR) repeat protein
LSYPAQIEEPTAFDESEAVQLLITRTKQYGAPLFLNRQRALIARLCVAIQGMPLALEMAATLLREISLDDLTTQLEASFDPLQSPLRNVPERQRNLRRLFDQSWRFLSNTERRILAQLSGFAGSISETAAQAIAGATAEHLERLVAKSMLQAQSNGRYNLHPVIRQYALEQMENPHETLEKHAHWFEHYAHSYHVQLHTLEFRPACDAIELESDNLQAALRWLATHQRFEDVIRLLHPLAQWFILMERNATGIALLTEARGLISPSGIPNTEYRQAVGWLLNYNIRFLLQQRLYKEAEELVSQSLPLYDALTPDAYLQTCLCNNYAAFYLNAKQDLQHAERHAQTAIALASQHGYADEQGKALNTLAVLQTGLGYYEQAHQALAQALQLGIQDPLTLASALHQKGMIEFKRGRYEDSLRYFEQVLEFDRKHQFDSHYARTILIYGSSLIGLDRFDEAEQALLQSTTFFQMAGHRVMMAASISQLGDVKMKTGRAEAGIAHYEEAAQIMQAMNQFYGLAQTYGNVAFAILDATLIDLYPIAFEYALSSVDVARAHQFDAHLDRALGLAGQVKLRLGNFDSARAYLIEGLQIALRLKSDASACEHLCGLAEYLCNTDNPELACHICEALLVHRAITEMTADAARKILGQIQSDALGAVRVDEEISPLFERFINLNTVTVDSETQETV